METSLRSNLSLRSSRGDPQMEQTNRHLEKNLSRVIFHPLTYNFFLKPSFSGLCKSEKEAYQLILEFMEPGEMSHLEKLNFLNAVATLSSVVRYQANGNMNNYYPKTLLAKKIETFIQQEPTEILDSSVRQQAMLCIVALSQVKPPFHLCQKLDLVNVSITSVFSLPPIMPSLDRKDNASLYLQTIQALDDMLHALVLEQRSPDMLILQNFIEKNGARHSAYVYKHSTEVQKQEDYNEFEANLG